MKKLLTLALAIALVAIAALSFAEVLTIGATAVPHEEILEFAKPYLAEKGIELNIIEFDDYVQPNLQLESGDLDANYFQHIPYMENFNAEQGTHLVSAGAVHYEPMGIYGGKSSDLTAIPTGASIGIPNDPTNEARALNLLVANGIITLEDTAGALATVLDVKDNPYKIELVEIEASQLPNMLQDFDFAIINSNYALAAGPEKVGSALVVEGTEIAYPNIITIREGDERESIKTLVEFLQSETVVNWIVETYGTAVVPTK